MRIEIEITTAYSNLSATGEAKQLKWQNAYYLLQF